MEDNLLYLHKVSIENIGAELGLFEVKILEILSNNEGGKFLIGHNAGQSVLTLTDREVDKIKLQKLIIDDVALQGVQVSRITAGPISVEGYTVYLSEYLVGSRPMYSRQVLQELTFIAAKIAKTTYSRFPNTGARHDPSNIFKIFQKVSFLN